MRDKTQTSEKATKGNAFIIGAKPPQSLSPEAKKQLSGTKPSQRALKLAASAARVLASNNVVVKTSAEAARKPLTGTKPRTAKATAPAAKMLRSKKATAGK